MKRMGWILLLLLTACRACAALALASFAQTLEEWTDTGTGLHLAKTHTYGLDLISTTQSEIDPISGIKFQVSSFYCYDGHGSVRALADETGTITDTYSYDAFGNQLSQSGSTDNAYRYCGEYFDADLALYYLRARHLNPNTGRFHTLDSYEGRNNDPLTLHKYMYAHANAVMGSDPSGLFNMLDVLGAGVLQRILKNAENKSAFLKLRSYTSRLCRWAGKFAGKYNAVRKKFKVFDYFTNRKGKNVRRKVFEAHHVLMNKQMVSLYSSYRSSQAFAIPLLGGSWLKHSPHGSANRYQRKFRGKYKDNPMRLAKGTLRAAGCSKKCADNLVKMAADWDSIKAIVEDFNWL